MTSSNVLQPSVRQGLFNLSFRGIKVMGDMALWKKPIYSLNAMVVLLSLYGSESQLRAIFSALVTNNELVIETGEGGMDLIKGWEGHLRFKSWKMGYGKYHALIWNEELVTKSVTVIETSEVEAWEAFIKKRKVPILREWIPDLISILEREELLTELDGVNLKGWLWNASDDTVCDKIVEEIYR